MSGEIITWETIERMYRDLIEQRQKILTETPPWAQHAEIYMSAETLAHVAAMWETTPQKLVEAFAFLNSHLHTDKAMGFRLVVSIRAKDVIVFQASD